MKLCPSLRGWLFRNDPSIGLLEGGLEEGLLKMLIYGGPLAFVPGRTEGDLS